MADAVPRDGPAPRTGGLIATAVYLRRDERHGAAGLFADGLLSCAYLPAGGVRGVRRLAAPMAGHVGGELGTGGDVQLGEDVREVGLHGPA